MVDREYIVKIQTKTYRSHSKKIFEARGDERHSSNTLQPSDPMSTIPSTIVNTVLMQSHTLGKLS